MKLTGTYNGKPIELELTEEQVEVLEQAEKKETGWERAKNNKSYNIAEIGKKVKLLREAASFTQQQLADYLSVDQSLISKFEKGERSINSDALKQLSVLFCSPISALVSDDEVKLVYNVAFRTNAISQEDLMALSVINRIALNQLQMDQLAGGLKHD